MFEVKDSGQRQEFSNGMVRDTQEGKTDWWRVAVGPMLERWAIHLTKGNVKYPDVEPGVPNWTLAAGEEEYQRFRQSAFRHFMQWFNGQMDEDHAAAVFFNICGAEFVKAKSPRSVAWAAGLFEGEGSITIRTPRKANREKKPQVQLQLASTDADTIPAFQATLGVGKVYGPYGPYQKNRQAHWRWDAYGDEAKKALQQMLPYLFSRRRAKAEEALTILA